MFFIRGAAPPPSRKFIETPDEPPLLVDAKPPSKYGARLTAVPLYMPGARIPSTLMPTFGCVSTRAVSFTPLYPVNAAVLHLQFPMTAVFTTRVRRVIWLAAVLFFNSAVV
jgi:hypothetical protein